MFVIEKYSYFKPYEDDTGFTLMNSLPYLTAGIDKTIQEHGIELPFMSKEAEIINETHKKDYRPLFDSDPTDVF